MKKHSKLLFISTTLLSLLMLAGCNMPEPSTDSAKTDSTVNDALKDGEVTEKVKSALLLDETIKGFDIAVVTTKGDVRLTGVVDNQSQLEKVDTIVRDIEGVHSIHDEVSVRK